MRRHAFRWAWAVTIVLWLAAINLPVTNYVAAELVLADASIAKTPEQIAEFAKKSQLGREQTKRLATVLFTSSIMLLIVSSWTYHRARKVWWT